MPHPGQSLTSVRAQEGLLGSQVLAYPQVSGSPNSTNLEPNNVSFDASEYFLAI
jgi:hypothetical protein